MKKTKVWLVILHYSDQPMTRACLESLAKIKTPGFEIQTLVVFNNPRENPTKLKKDFPQVLFLETGENLGFAGGNNVGLDYALSQGADWVLLLNNDTEVAPDFLAELLKVGKAQEKAAMISPKILFAKGYEYHKKRYSKKDLGKVIWYAGGKVDWANIATPHRGVDEVDSGQYDQMERIEFGSGCTALLRSAALKKVGLLDERYFLYYEDADLSQRFLEAGYEIWYAPASVVHHKVSGSSSIGGELHDYFLVRNQLLFGLKHAPLRSKLALVKQSIRFLVKGRKWQKQGVIDFYRRRFYRGSWRKENEK